MDFKNFALIALVALPLALNIGCSDSSSGTGGTAGDGGGAVGHVAEEALHGGEHLAGAGAHMA